MLEYGNRSSAWETCISEVIGLDAMVLLIAKRWKPEANEWHSHEGSSLMAPRRHFRLIARGR